MEYEKGKIYFFECDQRGRNTRNDGFLNSNKGYERPFVIISSEMWNKSQRNDGMYAIPLTKSGSGNTFSFSLGNDDIKDSKEFVGSIVLCDKICRVSERDKYVKHFTNAKLGYQAISAIKNKINQFIRTNF